MNDLCEFVFYFNDELVQDQISSPILLKCSTQSDYLSEPTSLLVSLSSLKNNDKSRNKLSKTKSRSRSVPQFSNLLNGNEVSSSKNIVQENIAVSVLKSEEIIDNEIINRPDPIESAKPVFSIDLIENKSSEINSDSAFISHVRESSLPLAANITDDEKYQQISSTVNPKKNG